MARIRNRIMTPEMIRWVFLLCIFNIVSLLRRHFCQSQLKSTERILYTKMLFLSSFIVLCIIIAYVNRKHRKMTEKADREFWERESAANNVRKKPLDDLAYITIPFDSLPMDTMADDPTVQEITGLLSDLSALKIVNLTGLTNTDLKLEYGTANITCLTEYDQNYTLLARTLQQWAEVLYTGGFEAEAAAVLEFAVSTRTDVSHSYYLLADIYDRRGESEKKAHLLEIAGTLRSSMKNVIVRTLQGAGPYSGWLHSA